jgi:hypothetical protein
MGLHPLRLFYCPEPVTPVVEPVETRLPVVEPVEARLPVVELIETAHSPASPRFRWSSCRGRK